MVSDIYPFQGHYADLNGVRCHYLDEGSGAPVVMLHGNPTWSFYYRRLVAALSDRYRTVAPDHVGCGRSEKPGDDRYAYVLERRVEDLELLLGRLGIEENLTLVMHDWGGMIGMTYAARHPQRIARLIAMNTAAFHLPAHKRLPLALQVARSPLGALLVRGLNLFSRAALRLCAVQHRFSADERAGYLAPYDSWANRIAVHRFVQDIPLHPGDPSYPILDATARRLPALAGVPLLLLWGVKDFVFDLHFLAEWQRRMPHAEIHRFEQAGHFVLEDAFDEIRPLIEDFLTR